MYVLLYDLAAFHGFYGARLAMVRVAAPFRQIHNNRGRIQSFVLAKRGEKVLLYE
jgi:hypothetical protein